MDSLGNHLRICPWLVRMEKSNEAKSMNACIYFSFAWPRLQQTLKEVFVSLSNYNLYTNIQFEFPAQI